MSHSWFNQLRVVLCPDQVILLGWGRGIRRKLIVQTILPCVSQPGAPGWQAALEALERWLTGNEVGRMRVTVILSDHFVRYALMPYSADVTSRAEEQALAKILFEGIYGESATQWRLCIGEGGFGEARLIAATDSSLLERLPGLFEGGALSLCAIVPYFVEAFNAFFREISDPDGLFVVVESGLMLVVVFRESQISGVRRVRLGSDQEMSDLLRRELLTSGLAMETVPVYMHVVGRTEFVLSSSAGLSIHVLRHPDVNDGGFVEDARFDMAISGGCR